MYYALVARRITMICASVALTLSLSTVVRADDVSKEADQVVEKAIKAMGGRKAIEKIESYKSKSVMNMAMINMESEVQWSKGDKLFMKNSAPQMGTMTLGSDGTTHWILLSMMGGYRLASDEEFQNYVDQGTFHMKMLTLDESMKEDFGEIIAVGTGEFNGLECVTLEIEEKPDSPDGEATKSVMYFDSKTDLPCGMEGEEQGMGGPQTLTIKFDDWKQVGDLKLFHTVTIKDSTQSANITYENVELNSVDPAVFELPEEVKALKESKPTSDPDSDERSIDDFTPQQQQMIRPLLTQIESQSDPNALRMMISGMESQKASVPADFKEVFEFVIAKAKARLAQLES